MGVLAEPLIFGEDFVMLERDAVREGLEARELIRDPARDPRREFVLKKKQYYLTIFILSIFSLTEKTLPREETCKPLKLLEGVSQVKLQNLWKQLSVVRLELHVHIYVSEFTLKIHTDNIELSSIKKSTQHA